MKILGGQYKGLNIDTSKITSYRPTQARVRKSIYDILTPFTYSNILDLYSGSGILGFESAIQRDYPVMFGTLFIFTLLGLIVGIISDLMYTVIDPRIDFETREN